MKSALIKGLIALIVVLAAWGIYKIASSEKAKEPPKKPNPMVSVVPAETGEISELIDLTGSVEPTRLAKLASPAEGPILNSRVREGDVVKQGFKVLSIGRKKATEALLISARQDLESEKEELARIEQLVESGAIPKDQLDTAKARYSRMVAQLARVKENSEDYDVEAPWDGIISKVLVNDGNYVAARTVLVEMFDPKSLVVRMAVPEAQSQEIKPDMDVSVKLDAYHGKSFRGKISRIYPDLDRRMRTRIAEVEIKDDVALDPGMFARLDLKLRTEKDRIVVPAQAVIVTPTGLRVAFIIEDGKAVQRKIKTGLESEGKIQILSGINPGEQIVIAGNEKLKDGMAVRVQGKTKPDQKTQETPQAAPAPGAAK